MRKRSVASALVALGGALALATYAAYRSDVDAAQARVAQGSAVLETPCGRIEYARSGAGPTVLVVHGAGGGFDQGMDFGQELVGNGFQVIAVSRFGYLRTPLPADASAAAQADAHACLLDGLGIARTAVLGASAGAPSALQLALRYPARTSAVVLLVPAIYGPRPGGTLAMRAPATTQFFFDTALRSDFLFWVATRIARRTLTHAILATPSSVVDEASAEEKARVASILNHILPVSERRRGLVNDAVVTSSAPRYDLEKIAAPTLIIGLQDDLFGTFGPAHYTAENIPGARFVGYARGGHVWVGHQQEIVREVSVFLRPALSAESQTDGK